ncbi:glycoside hydrolase superfamily [Aspergillus floccosus]
MEQLSIFKRLKPLLTIILLLQWFCIQVVSQVCSARNPCAAGGYTKSGYCGTGDDYCASHSFSTDLMLTPLLGYAKETDTRLANCHYMTTTGESCGLTGTEKVRRPVCGKSHPLSRVVGYYEGWSPDRSRKPFYPLQIPPNINTHLNYAFATINPKTFEVGAANRDEASRMERLVGLKTSQPSLRVNIAIGGWTFNNPGPTASTFSDLVRSEENQKKFFRSLVSFMSTYGFDGVDIDWEYPAADDRHGRPEDFDNFPKFMTNLKKVLLSTGGRDELSLTLPKSYRYLQHFDLKALEKSVDYFNYMSYDLHGKWDREKEVACAFLDSHSNLTEIREAMDLLWRHDISADKVVLGLPFYGRVYTIADANCKKPGCRFASAGNPGICSRQAGVLLNSELDDIRKEKNIQATLDTEAAVQILTWDRQWAHI